ncbi:MAG TPA: hypothetical protein VGG05_02615 [Pseudonocardiaceae bacterium]
MTVHAATSVVDAVGSFARAVAGVASGELVASCLWGDEPGGVFIDLAMPRPGHVLLVMHELAMPGWLTPEDEPAWLPVRGRPVLSTRVPALTFLHEVVSALGALEPLAGNETGIRGWGHPFPVESATRIREGMAELHRRTRFR